MAKDIEINYFDVTVKLERKTDEEDKAGNPKIKKWNEKFIVHAKTSEEATDKIKKEYDGVTDTWRIAQVKETQYLDVID